MGTFVVENNHEYGYLMEWWTAGDGVMEWFATLDGKLGLNWLGRLVSQMREKRNKWVEVSSEPGFWEFNQKSPKRTPQKCVPKNHLSLEGHQSGAATHNGCGFPNLDRLAYPSTLTWSDMDWRGQGEDRLWSRHLHYGPSPKWVKGFGIQWNRFGICYPYSSRDKLCRPTEL